MADALATVEELQSRLDWVLDSLEQGVAEGALEDLSDDARFYGSPSWASATAPRQAKSLVLRAAARFLRNPDGYTQSRAGDETLMWADRGDQAGTAFFTAAEQKMLGTLGGKTSSGLYTVPLVAWGDGSAERYDELVPVKAGSYGAAEPRPFPFNAEEDNGW